MGFFHIVAVLLVVAAGMAYVNHRFLRMPATIALMLMSLIIAVGLLGLAQFGGAGLRIEVAAEDLIRGIDFPQVLLGGLLPLLLFAGALHVNLDDLAENRWSIATFATFGVLGSTFAVGAMVLVVARLMDLPLGWIDCLLFGALISPTDPIAVLGILRRADAPKRLETRIAGESLFNDGIGVVVFLALLEISQGHGATVEGLAGLFAIEAIGGVALGLALGYIAFRLLRSVDDYQVEVLITLALVFGGYALADALHTSGPLAMVAAGLLVGNHGRRLGMSARTREHLDNFWELLDSILNAVLFVLIGMEALVLTLSGRHLLAGAVVVPLVLLARLLSVGIPVSLLRLYRPFGPGAVRVLTWGGLRGGISVALALSLPAGMAREAIVTITYFVVAFSILVQGLTVRRVVAMTRG
jgi:Na+:H+ antiporter